MATTTLEGVPYVEVPMEHVRGPPRLAPAERERPRFVRENRCVVEKCCCASLATGVSVLGALDVVVGAAAIVAAVLALVAATHEHAIDAAIEHAYVATNATATGADDTIAHVNRGLHHAARAAPWALALGVAVIGFGALGLRAGSASPTPATRDAARGFAVWKAVHLAFAVSSFSLLHVAWSAYGLLVARSRYLELLYLEIPLYEAAAAVFAAGGPAATPVLTTLEPSSSKVAEDEASKARPVSS